MANKNIQIKDGSDNAFPEYKLSNTIIVRNSNSITQTVSSGGKGFIDGVTFSQSIPSGYQEVSRCFERTDDGGYSISVFCPLNMPYITYESLGSAPTLKGYVVSVLMKI